MSASPPLPSPDPAPPAGDDPPRLDLRGVEALAAQRGLILRLRAPQRLGIWSLQVGVARPLGEGAAALLGELKGWALPTAAGLRLDTMRVPADRSAVVGPLIWAATFAWALECTPCRRATLLAIRDGDRQHRRLVRYFRGLGFQPLRELGGAPLDLLPRLIWGGAGLLMAGECREGLQRSVRRLALPSERCRNDGL